MWNVNHFNGANKTLVNVDADGKREIHIVEGEMGDAIWRYCRCIGLTYGGPYSRV